MTIEASLVGGRWRVSEHGVFWGTIRIAKFDFDTEPNEVFRESVYKGMADMLNGVDRTVLHRDGTVVTQGSFNHLMDRLESLEAKLQMNQEMIEVAQETKSPRRRTTNTQAIEGQPRPEKSSVQSAAIAFSEVFAEIKKLRGVYVAQYRDACETASESIQFNRIGRIKATYDLAELLRRLRRKKNAD